MSVRIYLCGSIAKDSDDKKLCWGGEEKDTIRRIVRDAELMDPQRNPERDDPVAAFGMDLLDIKKADFVMVDARERRGIGIGAEMVIAKMMEKPVVTVSPRNSHYRRDCLNHFGKEISNWKHPFIVGLSDAVTGSVEEAAEWIREFLGNPGKVKNSKVIQEAIDYYLQKRGGKT